jgi:hypothetical protein
MRRAAEHWSYARECEHWATKTPNGQDRKIFFDMAKTWVELALKEQSVFQTTESCGLLCDESA